MRKRLQIALMASTVAATSLSLTAQLRAADGDGPSQKITATDEHGRKIYVNDSTATSPARHTQQAQPPRRTLMYWSSKDNRWKPVPPPNAAAMRAARSAAAEVNQYVGRESIQSANAKIVAANFSNSLTTATTGVDIDSAIEQAAARHNVDPNLVRAVVKVESNFNPNALSRKGAMGLMQLMPSTARQLNVKNPFDPEQNVDAGVRHLKQLLESYGGDIKLTLAAYNAGAGAVARSSGVPRYAETQNYVRRITDLYYGGSPFGRSVVAHDPVRIQRDARGVLYISNTE
ncbi:MAG TPA: lytic transglycosylase domain-containing protein [Candidatus Acidoferrales bacterium]|nr:lytic transglycosylase domain-containing protein [Candidatus Acidoferrales bacterium]